MTSSTDTNSRQQQEQERPFSRSDCFARCIPHYFNLHLPTDATQSEIKSAYRFFSRILHPDKYSFYYRQHPPSVLQIPSPYLYFPFLKTILDRMNVKLGFPVTSALLPKSWTTTTTTTATALSQDGIDLALQLVQEAYAVLRDPRTKSLYDSICSRHFQTLSQIQRQTQSQAYTVPLTVQGWEDSSLISYKARGRKPWFWEYSVGIGSKKTYQTSSTYWDGETAGAMETVVNAGHWVVDNWVDWGLGKCGIGWRDEDGVVQDKGWADWIWGVCETMRNEMGGEWMPFREANTWERVQTGCSGKVVWVWIPRLGREEGREVRLNSGNGTGRVDGVRTNYSKYSQQRSNTDISILSQDILPMKEVFDQQTLDNIYQTSTMILWILGIGILGLGWMVLRSRRRRAARRQISKEKRLEGVREEKVEK